MGVYFDVGKKKKKPSYLNIFGIFYLLN
jgi:hypothetical protein